jgi:hypothetical protein
MNKNRILTGLIILAVVVATVVTWRHMQKTAQSGAGLTSTTPRVIAPAHVIPPDVSENMQEAVAEREKKLQELSQNKPVAPINGH